MLFIVCPNRQKSLNVCGEWHIEEKYLPLLIVADIFLKNVIRQKYFDSLLSKDRC